MCVYRQSSVKWIQQLPLKDDSQNIVLRKLRNEIWSHWWHKKIVKVPPTHGGLMLTFASSNWLLWIHLFRSSVLLFSSFLGGQRAMAVFSCMQSWQLLDPFRYMGALLLIDHLILYCLLAFFSFQMWHIGSKTLLRLFSRPFWGLT